MIASQPDMQQTVGMLPCSGISTLTATVDAGFPLIRSNRLLGITNHQTLLAAKLLDFLHVVLGTESGQVIIQRGEVT